MWAGLENSLIQVDVGIFFPLFKTQPKNAYVHTSPKKAFQCGHDLWILDPSTGLKNEFKPSMSAVVAPAHDI